MAYRRSLTSKVNLYTQHRFSPSVAYINSDDEHKKHQYLNEDPRINNLSQTTRSFSSSRNTLSGFGSPFQNRRCSNFGAPAMSASVLARHMSTTIGEGADKIDFMTDVAEVLADKTLEAVTSQVPAISEVALAAADSWPPVAALQYFIDGVHNFTGLNWWASIVITTFVIRGLTVPLMINQLKATTKLSLMRPRLEEVKQDMHDRGMSPSAVTEGQAKMAQIFKEYGITPWTPLKGILIQGPVFISFFLAIQNMVEKVPSFKTGGFLWFTDLTTPDAFYILPFVTALTFLITVECNMQEGLEGNPAAGTMKNVSRVFAVLTVPFTMTFPKAIFCYWVTSNIFSLFYGLVIKRPGVKKFLNVPILPAAPPSEDFKPAFTFMEAMKKYVAAQQKQQIQPPQSPELDSKTTPQRISSSSVLSQRIKMLEKGIKSKKKNKKR